MYKLPLHNFFVIFREHQRQIPEKKYLARHAKSIRPLLFFLSSFYIESKTTSASSCAAKPNNFYGISGLLCNETVSLLKIISKNNLNKTQLFPGAQAYSMNGK